MLGFFPLSGAPIAGTGVPAYVPVNYTADVSEACSAAGDSSGAGSFIDTLLESASTSESATGGINYTLAGFVFVGYASATSNPSLTALTGGADTQARAGDIVLCIAGEITGSEIGWGSYTPSGYTLIGWQQESNVRSGHVSVSYKVMGNTPDTTIPSSVDCVAYVIRGGDATTTIDCTPTTASNPGWGDFDPSAITTTTDSAYILTALIGSLDFTPPTGYSNTASVGLAYGHKVAIASKQGDVAGVYNPSIWNTPGGSGNFSAGVTFAIRRATSNYFVQYASATESNNGNMPLTASESETATLAQTAASTVSLNSDATNTVTAADSPSTIYGAAAASTEPVTALDAATGAANWQVAIPNPNTAETTQTSSTQLVSARTEAATGGNTQTTTWSATADRTEATTSSNTSTAAQGTAAASTEPVTASDLLSAVANFIAALTEAGALSTTDTGGLQALADHTSTATLADSSDTGQGFTSDSVETVTLSESASSGVGMTAAISATSATRNWFLYSADLASMYAGGQATTLTSNYALNPYGNKEAARFYSNAGAACNVWPSGIPSFAATTQYVFSVYAKRVSGDSVITCQVVLGGVARSVGVFNLETLAASGYGSSKYIEDAGEGWKRCIVVFTSEASLSYFNKLIISNTGSNVVAATEWLLWGAQLEEGSVPTPLVTTTNTPNVGHDRLTGAAVGGGLGQLVAQDESATASETSEYPLSTDYSDSVLETVSSTSAATGDQEHTVTISVVGALDSAQDSTVTFVGAATEALAAAGTDTCTVAFVASESESVSSTESGTVSWTAYASSLDTATLDVASSGSFALQSSTSEGASGAESSTSASSTLVDSAAPAAASDIASALAAWVASLSDSGALAESSAATLAYLSALTEPATPAENSAAVSALLASAGESLTANAVQTNFITFLAAMSEAGLTVDIPTAVAAFLSVIQESVAPADVSTSGSTVLANYVEPSTTGVHTYPENFVGWNVGNDTNPPGNVVDNYALNPFGANTASLFTPGISGNTPSQIGIPYSNRLWLEFYDSNATTRTLSIWVKTHTVDTAFALILVRSGSDVVVASTTGTTSSTWTEYKVTGLPSTANLRFVYASSYASLVYGAKIYSGSNDVSSRTANIAAAAAETTNGPDLAWAGYAPPGGFNNVVSGVTASGFSTTAGTGGATRVYLDLTTVAGKTYSITVTYAVDFASMYARNGTGGLGAIIGDFWTSSGTYQFTAISTTTTILWARDPATAFVVTGIAIKEVVGSSSTNTVTFLSASSEPASPLDAVTGAGGFLAVSAESGAASDSRAASSQLASSTAESSTSASLSTAISAWLASQNEDISASVQAVQSAATSAIAQILETAAANSSTSVSLLSLIASMLDGSLLLDSSTGNITGYGATTSEPSSALDSATSLRLTQSESSEPATAQDNVLGVNQSTASAAEPLDAQSDSESSSSFPVQAYEAADATDSALYALMHTVFVEEATPATDAWLGFIFNKPSSYLVTRAERVWMVTAVIRAWEEQRAARDWAKEGAGRDWAPEAAQRDWTT